MFPKRPIYDLQSYSHSHFGENEDKRFHSKRKHHFTFVSITPHHTLIAHRRGVRVDRSREEDGPDGQDSDAHDGGL